MYFALSMTKVWPPQSVVWLVVWLGLLLIDYIMGLDILWNDTININDEPHIFLKVKKVKGKIYFKRFSRDSKSPLILTRKLSEFKY